MAGRIRTVKPELNQLHWFAALSDAAARMYFGLLGVVDDAGRCAADPAFIAGQIFWGRQRTANAIGRLLSELEDAGIIRRYRARGGSYLEILGWFDKGGPLYQQINKPQGERFPAPEQETDRPTAGPPTGRAAGTDPIRESIREPKGTERESKARAPSPTTSPEPPEDSSALALAVDPEPDQAELERSPGATANAPADPEPAPIEQDRGAAVRRLIAAAWELGAQAFQRLAKDGIDPTARDAWTTTPPADAPPMRALKQIAEQLLDQHRTEEAALSVIRHRVEVARAEGYSKATRCWMTPMSMWNANSFAIACEKSPEQFRPQSAGPRRNASNEQLHKTRNLTAEERAETQAEHAKGMQELGFATAQGDQKL